MFKKRIIPCLDIQNGRTVKGTNFVNLRDAGDPVELALRYEAEGADELVLLDIAATIENRFQSIQLIETIAERLHIPFTIGGGVKTADDAIQLIEHGADKVGINSAAVAQPELISEIANVYGSQAVVVAVDATWDKSVNDYRVYIHGGRTPSERLLTPWLKEAENRGAGEILLTSIDRDGTKQGFDIDMLRSIDSHLPVIASGGAGSISHFRYVFHHTKATGALAASIFHFQEIRISDLKQTLATNGIPVREDI